MRFASNRLNVPLYAQVLPGLVAEHHVRTVGVYVVSESIRVALGEVYSQGIIIILCYFELSVGIKRILRHLSAMRILLLCIIGRHLLHLEALTSHLVLFDTLTVHIHLFKDLIRHLLLLYILACSLLLLLILPSHSIIVFPKFPLHPLLAILPRKICALSPKAASFSHLRIYPRPL